MLLTPAVSNSLPRRPETTGGRDGGDTAAVGCVPAVTAGAAASGVDNGLCAQPGKAYPSVAANSMTLRVSVRTEGVRKLYISVGASHARQLANQR